MSVDAGVTIALSVIRRYTESRREGREPTSIYLDRASYDALREWFDLIWGPVVGGTLIRFWDLEVIVTDDPERLEVR